ncbi:MAG: hypothetical protein KatS3mg113_1123 [Planctomycetaceae bacterium]|nr:MAG: hypothetical protein KatS3mg113_1123 [Planctomycetaceae bacterium]
MTIRWYSPQELLKHLRADDVERLRLIWKPFPAQLWEANGTSTLFPKLLRECLLELSAQALVILRYGQTVETLLEIGRWSPPDTLTAWLREVLDRRQLMWSTESAARCWGLLPLEIPDDPQLVLGWQTRQDHEVDRSLLALLAHFVSAAWCCVERQRRQQQLIAKLRGVLAVTPRLLATADVQEMLELLAVEATRLLDCDRASIFLWDREHRELIAVPALGLPGGSLRVSDHQGLVGEVLHSGKALRVADTYADPRFSAQIDQASGYRTRNVLAVPLFDNERRPAGVFEVINKHSGDFDPQDEDVLAELAIQVTAVLQNVKEREVLFRSHQHLTEQITRGVSLIGDSPAMAALRSTVHRLASTDLPVLILGESGTGKEVIAQALHYFGNRARHPFVAVNCAALTETLLESELFGHEKGAFTDAHEMRRGKFELAEGGTLFLDEIGDLSSAGQAKLLRVLEQKVITRVGGSQTIPIDVRVVAATNARLADAVRAKKFREDLYFRLNVVTLELPPLRDRLEDILPLAQHFLRQFAVNARRPHLQLSKAAEQRLLAHPWPGNVRELRNLMERLAFLAPHDVIEPDDLTFILDPKPSPLLHPEGQLGLSEATDHFQREYIRAAIRKARGNMSQAAKLLGLHRSNLYRKMRQLGMQESFEPEEDAFTSKP